MWSRRQCNGCRKDFPLVTRKQRKNAGVCQHLCIFLLSADKGHSKSQQRALVFHFQDIFGTILNWVFRKEEIFGSDGQMFFRL